MSCDCREHCPPICHMSISTLSCPIYLQTTYVIGSSACRINLGDFIFQVVLLYSVSKDGLGHGRATNVAYKNAHSELSSIPLPMSLDGYLPKHTNKTLIGSLDIFCYGCCVKISKREKRGERRACVDFCMQNPFSPPNRRSTISVNHSLVPVTCGMNESLICIWMVSMRNIPFSYVALARASYSFLGIDVRVPLLDIGQCF